MILINTLLGQKVFNKTFRSLRTFISEYSLDYYNYFYCECNKLYGPIKTNSRNPNINRIDPDDCDSCQKIVNYKNLLKSGKYFMHIPLESQLKNIFENYSDKFMKNKNNSNKLFHVSDGAKIENMYFQIVFL